MAIVALLRDPLVFQCFLQRIDQPYFYRFACFKVTHSLTFWYGCDMVLAINKARGGYYDKSLVFGLTHICANGFAG
jgi:hypothetical protein